MNSPAAVESASTPLKGSHASKTIRVAFVGNPNTGKTTLFNVITGLNQKVGNYPGVTVERKVGRLQRGAIRFEFVDLPGTYSLAARSLDEMVVTDILLDQQVGEEPVDLIVAVVDASNLNRNFYLLSQIIEVGKPIVVALNMMDIAEAKGIQINVQKLSNCLGLPMVSICASKKQGIGALLETIEETIEQATGYPTTRPAFPEKVQQAVNQVQDWIQTNSQQLHRPVLELEIFRALIDEDGYAEERLTRFLGPGFREHLHEVRKRLNAQEPLVAEEAVTRYEWISQILCDCVRRPDRPVQTLSDKIDRILTHKVYGFAIFIMIMALIFQAIYTWAAPVMDFMDSLFVGTGGLVTSIIPEGALQSLIVDGIIGGVGSVLIFLPQIAILFFFIGILEDCGYMPRAAFMMDRVLSKVGLSGKSFIPLLSSFACAVPGVMATRTIENRRDRLITILIAPLMSCSARLPVYLIMIAAFIPSTALFGTWINLQAFTLLLFYLLGIAVAIPMALIFKKILHKGQSTPFVLEFPSFKWPMPRSVALYVYEQSKEFVVRAGTIIFCFSVIIWALTYFPRPDSIENNFDEARQTAQVSLHAQALPLLHEIDPQTYPVDMSVESLHSTLGEDPRFVPDEEVMEVVEVPQSVQKVAEIYSDYAAVTSALNNEQSGEYVRSSFLGRFGRVIEPVVEPLGWDWRIGMAALASFPARELVVASLGTIMNVGSDQDEASVDLRTALREAKKPNGEPLFNIAVALSLMVFFALCAQCVSTLAIIKRETNSWTWPLVTFGYMTVLAYLGAMLAFQLGSVFLL